jgi:glutathione S-transferase
MSAPYTLYDYLPSGNGYKVRLTAKRLGIPYQCVQMDITQGETRTPEFLAKNSNGRIPLLEIPGRGYLAESHAIISFLADGSELIPVDAWSRAHMWQWLCFEQYHVEPNIGTARFWLHHSHKTAAELGESLAEKIAKGREALSVVERDLGAKRYFVADRFTLADIALYAYIHVAPEAGIALDEYPRIRAWLARVAAQPGHRPITEP